MFFATDIANFLACRRLLTLDRAEERGQIAKPVSVIPGLTCSVNWGTGTSKRFFGIWPRRRTLSKFPLPISRGRKLSPGLWKHSGTASKSCTRPRSGMDLGWSKEASVLPVQGPPGSGKTYTGARMIVELVKRGRRVGIDVLFIDEAGQMSLANVLAISQAATSSVLLGDPQQLDQPQKGIHPPGAEGPAFDHLLQGRSTITADQGLFLTETRRLHPDICNFTSELKADDAGKCVLQVSRNG